MAILHFKNKQISIWNYIFFKCDIRFCGVQGPCTCLEKNVIFCIFLFKLLHFIHFSWQKYSLNMFFKTKRSSIFTKRNTFLWVIPNKNRRKTKKWSISFKFDWILVMKSYNFNFYHFSLHGVVQRELKRILGLN